MVRQKLSSSDRLQLNIKIKYSRSVALTGEDKTFSSGIGAVGKGKVLCMPEDILFLLPRKESLR